MLGGKCRAELQCECDALTFTGHSVPTPFFEKQAPNLHIVYGILTAIFFSLLLHCNLLLLVID